MVIFFQTECKSKYPNGIGHDEIAIVKGGKLPCKKIYFVNLPVYGSSGTEEEVMTIVISLTLCKITLTHQSCAV